MPRWNSSLCNRENWGDRNLISILLVRHFDAVLQAVAGKNRIFYFLISFKDIKEKTCNNLQPATIQYPKIFLKSIHQGHFCGERIIVGFFCASFDCEPVQKEPALIHRPNERRSLT